MYDYPYEYYNRKRAKRKAFFAKAIVLFSVFALSAVAIVCVTAFSSEKAGFPDCVYLLAAETSDAEEVSSKGGAGVVYESGGERYPLYACYYVRAEAESVAARLRDAGESVSVLEHGGGALCFGGAAEKEAKNAVCAIGCQRSGKRGDLSGGRGGSRKGKRGTCFFRVFARGRVQNRQKGKVSRLFFVRGKLCRANG